MLLEKQKLFRTKLKIHLNYRYDFGNYLNAFGNVYIQQVPAGAAQKPVEYISPREPGQGPRPRAKATIR